jgi:hypothetical protein
MTQRSDWRKQLMIAAKFIGTYPPGSSGQDGYCIFARPLHAKREINNTPGRL